MQATLKTKKIVKTFGSYKNTNYLCIRNKKQKYSLKNINDMEKCTTLIRTIAENESSIFLLKKDITTMVNEYIMGDETRRFDNKLKYYVSAMQKKISSLEEENGIIGDEVHIMIFNRLKNLFKSIGENKLECNIPIGSNQYVSNVFFGFDKGGYEEIVLCICNCGSYEYITFDSFLEIVGYAKLNHIVGLIVAGTNKEVFEENRRNTNKNKKVGETIICPICKKHFVKKQYSQAFCSLKCKDDFWNHRQR